MGVVPGLQAEPVISGGFFGISHHIMTAAACSCSYFYFLSSALFLFGETKIEDVWRVKDLEPGLSLFSFTVSPSLVMLGLCRWSCSCCHGDVFLFVFQSWMQRQVMAAPWTKKRTNRMSSGGQNRVASASARRAWRSVRRSSANC